MPRLLQFRGLFGLRPEAPPGAGPPELREAVERAITAEREACIALARQVADHFFDLCPEDGTEAEEAAWRACEQLVRRLEQRRTLRT